MIEWHELNEVDMHCTVGFNFPNKNWQRRQEINGKECKQWLARYTSWFFQKNPAAAGMVERHELNEGDMHCTVRCIFPNKNWQRRQEINGKECKQWMSHFTSRFFSKKSGSGRDDRTA